MIIELHLNSPNRTKKETRKNAEILVNSVKSGLLGHSKRQKAIIQDSDLNFRYILSASVLIHILRFVKIPRVSLEIFGEKNLGIIFQFSKFSKKLK